MKVEYDKETDTLTIKLREARIKESDEVRPGVIADFGYDGGVVGFEILDASKVVEKTRECLFTVEDAIPAEAALREKPDKPYGQ
jgi:uncharacterized protein YuzE